MSIQYSDSDRINIVNTVFSLVAGNKIDLQHPYGWLTVFDSDELNDFLKEICEVYLDVLTSTKRDWSKVDILIYEWQESALAICSPELREAFKGVGDKEQ